MGSNGDSVSEFFVDSDGMNGLYNVLVRAAADADDTLQYTRKHCDLTFPEKGLLLNLMGPHRVAYAQMTEALQKLADLCGGAGTQVNRAQLDYARSDHTSVARLDAGYTGARNPADVFQTLCSGRTDLWTTRAAFADRVEPTEHLVDPVYASGVEMFEINPLADLVSPAAWLRQVTVWLFDHDPFEGWGQALSGDWGSYEHCAAAWGKVGNAAGGIGTNLLASAADVSGVWRGNAAEAEQEFQLLLARSAIGLEPICDQYHKLYLQAAEAAKKLYNVVTGLISKLIDVLIIINIAAAAGTVTIETGIGAVAGYGIAAYYTYQAYDLYNDISAFYGSAEALIKAIAGSIAAIKAGQEVASIPSLAPYHHPAGY